MALQPRADFHSPTEAAKNPCIPREELSSLQVFLWLGMGQGHQLKELSISPHNVMLPR